MFNSYKLFHSVVTTQLDNLTINEVIQKFQDTNDKKVKNMCFARVFCELFPLILKVHHKFVDLPTEIKTEECIHKTLNAMKRFNVENKKAKFSSYLHLSLENSLKGLTKSQYNLNRKVWKCLIDCDDKTRKHIQDSIRSYSDIPSKEFMLDLERNTVLNKLETDYCKALLLGQPIKKIPDLIDIASSVNFKNPYKKRTQKKSTRKSNNNVATTTPSIISPNTELYYLGKLKRSIKRKISENNFSIV